jgi:hypothetical protein
MYGNVLPKTGVATVALGVGGMSIDAPLPLVVAGIGLGLVLIGAAAVRFGFRRQKGVSQA